MSIVNRIFVFLHYFYTYFEKSLLISNNRIWCLFIHRQNSGVPRSVPSQGSSPSMQKKKASLSTRFLWWGVQGTDAVGVFPARRPLWRFPSRITSLKNSRNRLFLCSSRFVYRSLFSTKPWFYNFPFWKFAVGLPDRYVPSQGSSPSWQKEKSKSFDLL